MQRRTALKGLVAGATSLLFPVGGILPAAAAAALRAPKTATKTVRSFAPALDAPVESTGMSVVSAQLRTPMGFDMVGFATPNGLPVRYRTSIDGRTWRPWAATGHPHTDDPPDTGDAGDVGDVRGTEAKLSDPLWVGASRWLQIQSVDPAAVQAHLLDTSGLSTTETIPLAAPNPEPIDEKVFRGLALESSGAVAQPPIITRAQWGADESITGLSRAASAVRYAIVHHTAGSNDYTRDESAGIVRGIQRYHILNSGWSDVGYNFLIDKYGRVYEGRRGSIERPFIGAHAAGFNTGSVGVALIGNFDQATPTTMAMGALRVVLAWKFGRYNIDPLTTFSVLSKGSPLYPLGTTARLAAISGHRDTGQTSCPGTNLYAQLGGLARAVSADLSNRAAPVAGSGAASCQPEGNPSVGPVWRAAGENRIATAIEASRWYWKTVGTAVIAAANNFPDALSAGALAAANDAPILLTGSAELHSAVARRLSELGVTTALVLGGTAALSSEVDRGLTRQGIRVDRIAGANRYETAALSARRVGAAAGEVVLVAGGHSDAARAWPDAVAAGALAATPQRLPTLLTAQHTLPAATSAALRALGAHTVWIVGDATAVSQTVANQVSGMGMRVQRLQGTDRYGTSVAVAREARSRFPSAQTPLVLASGADYPDALAASAVAARRGAPVLLVPPCGLEQAAATKSYLQQARADYTEAVILGGTEAVSERIRWQVGTHLSTN